MDRLEVLSEPGLVRELEGAFLAREPVLDFEAAGAFG
jgi:hypothetical protein